MMIHCEGWLYVDDISGDEEYHVFAICRMFFATLFESD